MAKIRKTEEVRADIEAIEAEIAQLQAKAESEEGLTEEETARLAELVAMLEAAKQEEVVAESNERYAKIKVKDGEVKRSLPHYIPAEPKTEKYKLGSVFGHWACYSGPSAVQTVEGAAKVRSAGFDPNSNFLVVPFDWRKLNFKNRAVLSTGGAGTGAEWDYQTYHDVVFQHLTYETPLLGFLNTVNLDKGRERYFYDYDDTSMVSTDITASSGSETNPTIPEKNIESGRQSIKPKTITSGYQKVSLELLQDAPFSLEEKISAASNRSHARKMALDAVTGAGNGVTNVEGLLSLANTVVTPSAWDMDALEELVDSMPSYYRPGCIFLSNSATKSDVKRALKDTTGRTLFDKVVTANQDFDALLGYTWVEDANVPADQVLFINPAHYTLVIVNNQVFQRFDEKFFSHTAWAGMMRFGGARTGSESAFLSAELGS